MPEIEIVRFPSSDPAKVFTTYGVSVSNGVVTHCECKGWRFHGRCRHAALMTETLREAEELRAQGW